MKTVIAVIVASAGLAGAASAQVTLFDSGGFESGAGYSLGDLPGQNGWVEDSADGSDSNGRPVTYAPVPIVSDPTGGGHGQVMCIDPPGTGGGWQGVAVSFGPSTGSPVVVEWDQWRASLGDNLWVADSAAYDGWWSLQWDQDMAAHSQQFNESVALTAGVWQHVTYTFDFNADTVTVDVDGTSATHAGIGGTSIRGWDFEVEPTVAGGEDGPSYIDNFVATQVPTPGALALMGLGGLAAIRRRRA